MKSTPSGDSPAVAKVVDNKPYIEHHPTIGYRYIPNKSWTLPRPGGGQFLLKTNSIGIRSDREYAIPKPPGIFRIVVLGDSYSAGQYVSNDQRFTEILERRLPGVEVMNFALEGSGTDQQLLIFETIAKEFEPDLVILLPFLQNIRRNLVDARLSYDPETNKPVLVPKPRFSLKPDGSLELHNVPVPNDRHPVDASAHNDGGVKTDTNHSLLWRFKLRINGWFFMPIAKKFIYRIFPWEPFSEYKSADTDAWKLMEAIIHRIHTASGNKPLVIVPIFYCSYVMYNMARNYWDRFNSLTKTPGIFTIDVLPYFKKRGRAATRCYQDPYDVHFSAEGNLVVADAIERELRRAGLLSRSSD